MSNKNTYVSQEQIKRARKVDLYEFEMTYYSDYFTKEGHSIRLKSNHSVSIREGQTGYKDFSAGEKGKNSIDFLMNYQNYTFQDAVLALLGEDSCCTHSPSMISKTPEPEVLSKDSPQFPEKIDGPYRNVFAYLQKRGISADTIKMLVDERLLYQSKDHNNCVFISAERDFGELRGTNTYKPFHGCIAKSRHDGYWCMKNSSEPEVAYVCESSIDAISLYELHKLQGIKEKACYVGIGGVAKQPAIDRIKSKYRTIIAVDNDDAGSECRQRNCECESIYPTLKDWNEDLQALRARIKEEKQKEKEDQENEWGINLEEEYPFHL